VLERLAKRNVYAITSFIFGLDHDVPGVAQRTLDQIREWPAVLPVFGQITPFPATPLYERLEKEGRLTRPTHWLDFAPFHMAHTPLNMSVPEVQAEITYAWKNSYSPAATREAIIESLRDAPAPYRISHLIARLFFRGIYFPPKSIWGWLKLIAQNGGTIYRLTRDAFSNWPGGKANQRSLEFKAPQPKVGTSPTGLDAGAGF
jgi:hypothetical protein